MTRPSHRNGFCWYELSELEFGRTSSAHHTCCASPWHGTLHIVASPASAARSPVHDLAGLLAVVLAGPDAENALDGMHRVVLDIRDKAGMLQKACAGI